MKKKKWRKEWFSFLFQKHAKSSGRVEKLRLPVDLNTHCCSMHFHSLICFQIQPIPIQLSGTRIILLLGIGGATIVLPEELASLGISAQLHLPQLNPCPIRVQVRWAHERQMNPQISMDGWTINAYEYAVCDRRPGWIFRIAIETCLWTSTIKHN